MSFYEDDVYGADDIDGNVFGDDENKDSCPNCGSADFYRDDGGALVCNQCFTQSQTQTLVEETEYEDSANLAAKVGGRFVSRRKPAGSLLTDREIDESRPLPDLVQCCNGFQIVMKAAAERVAQLAGLDGDRGKEAMLEVVRSIWFGYLQAWMDGAEHFSKQFPELRFSLRDAFLTQSQRGTLLRHLSAVSVDRIRRRGMDAKGRSGTKKRRRLSLEESVEQRFCDSDKSVGIHGVASSGESSSSDADEKSRKIRDKHTHESTRSSRARRQSSASPSRPETFHRVIDMLNSLADKRRAANGKRTICSKEAALRLEPSMTLMASILHLSLLRLRAGVASFHITAWSSNGSLSHLLNGFHYLPSKVQEELQPIRSFFVRSSVPLSALIDHHSDLLAICCCLDIERPRVSVLAKPIPRKRAAVDGLSEANKHSQPVAYHDNAPLMAARIIRDVGLCQRVLDVTYALMGVSVPDFVANKNKADLWLPAPLPAASCDKLVSPLHVMAVVVVACKMCRGWENWKVAKPTPSPDFSAIEAAKSLEAIEDSPRGSIGSNESLSESEEVPDNGSTTKEEPAHSEEFEYFVPWNEEQLRMLGNGPAIESYLNFVDRTIFFGESVRVLEPFEEIVNSFGIGMESDSDFRVRSATRRRSTGAVKPNMIMAGAPNPNQPRNVKAKDENRLWKLHQRNRGAIWSDANAIGAYVIYDDDSKSTARRTNTGPVHLAREPFHPHYGLLVEYMSYKADADPIDLHELVTSLDKGVESHASRGSEVASNREAPQPNE